MALRSNEGQPIEIKGYTVKQRNNEIRSRLLQILTDLFPREQFGESDARNFMTLLQDAAQEHNDSVRNKTGIYTNISRMELGRTKEAFSDLLDEAQTDDDLAVIRAVLAEFNDMVTSKMNALREKEYPSPDPIDNEII